MTLPLDPAAARAAIALFEPAPPPEEAVRLAAMTGSWHEMLAHLLLVRASLPPAVGAAIRAASAGRARPATPRPPGPDLARRRAADAALDAALAALMQAEAAQRAVADAASAALGAQLAELPGSGADLHLRIAPGGT